MEEYTKIRHMEIHKIIVSGSGMIGLHIWDPSSTDTQDFGPSQYRFVLPYGDAIELGAQLASIAEKFQGEDFSS